MALSSTQLTVVRSWVGNNTPDSVLNERYDRWYLELNDEDAAAAKAIEEELRAQLTVLVNDQPGQLSAASGDSFNYQANIIAMRESLKSFLSLAGATTGGGAFRVGQLYRPSGR